MTRQSPSQPPFPFREYSSYLKERFGGRVQKISLSIGNTCPNRDGTRGKGGCTYCNIGSIQPNYLSNVSGVKDQLKKGIAFFASRRQGCRFLAYFQTYSNTYSSTEYLRASVEEALEVDGVVGIVISTRPDCIPDDTLEYLARLSLSRYVSVEIGIESTCNHSLERMNRCHTWSETVLAVNRLAAANIEVGGHLILSLPWESREEMIGHAVKLSALPLHCLKLHHLQVLKKTRLAGEHRIAPFSFRSEEEYRELVIEFLEHLRPDIVLQRFIAEAPPKFLVAPHWGGVRNSQFTGKLKAEMIKRCTWQGKTASLQAFPFYPSADGYAETNLDNRSLNQGY